MLYLKKLKMIPVLTNKTVLSQLDCAAGCVALIHKPEDWTSFDVVKKIRSALRIKKIGHGGTLDPFATGLMLIGIGKGTKELGRLSGLSKVYRAEICFGAETDTYDRTGTVVNEADCTHLSFEAIQKAVAEMSGKIRQVPPMYSAKRVNGVRLYKLARKNVEVEREAQTVQIFKADIEAWDKPILRMTLHVSKGTYIRSYAHDLGQKLGCGAYLNQLQRTAIEQYRLEDSFTIGKFIATYKEIDGSFTRS